MRLVLQRAIKASVTVDGVVVGSIGRGLVVLCGIADDDDDAAAEWACRKLLNIRLWEAGGKSWAHSVTQAGLDVLLVSQFTLHAQLKGNKPDFHRAMPPERARAYWEAFVRRVEQARKGLPVATGTFGAYMAVELTNDGPVTIVLDSNLESSQSKTPPTPTPAALPSTTPGARPRAPPAAAPVKPARAHHVELIVRAAAASRVEVILRLQ